MTENVFASWYTGQVETDRVAGILVHNDDRDLVGRIGTGVDTENVGIEAGDVNLQADVTEVNTVSVK